MACQIKSITEVQCKHSKIAETTLQETVIPIQQRGYNTAKSIKEKKRDTETSGDDF